MSSSLSVDDLVALNEELAGLVRAGVPLDAGLRRWGRDVGGRLGRLTKELGQRLARGESLDAALAAAGGGVPPVYRAIVVAGLRSGRLTTALETVTLTARSLQLARGDILLATLYPLVLLMAGYWLGFVLLWGVLPRISLLYEQATPWWLQGLIDAGQALAAAEVSIPLTDRQLPAVWLPPLVVLVLFCLWWWRTRRALFADATVASRWLVWIPPAARVARQAQTAALAELLGALVEHDVPLGTSVRLAAASSSRRRIEHIAEQTAAAIERGQPLDAAVLKRLWGAPIGWLLSYGGDQRSFVTLARHIAMTNRDRMRIELNWLNWYLPALLAVTVGGAATLLAALALYIPFTQLLQALSQVSQRGGRIQ